MLTIIPSHERRHHYDTTIKVPANISEEERKRLDGLAQLCLGHYSRAIDAYNFTEARGKKCWALFVAGFSVIDNRKKGSLSRLTHSTHRRVFNLSQAMIASVLIEKSRVPELE